MHFVFQRLSYNLLEEVVETDVVPQFLTITIIESACHLYRNHEVAVHHDLQATACGHVYRLFLAGVEGIERVEFTACSCVGSLLLLETIGLDYLSHIEEGVEGNVEVLVDEAEVDDAPAELGVEPCHAVADDTIAVDTTHRGVTAKALGVNLAEEEGVEVIDEVVGYLARELGLYAETVGEGELILPYGYVLATHEGEAQVAVSLAVDDVGGTYEGGFDVDAAGGVAIVVAGVVDESGLELEHIAAMGFVVADEACIAVHLVEGVLSIIALEVYVAGHDVIVAETCGPVQVACDAALHAGDEAELVAAHPVELGLLALVVAEAGAEVGRCIAVEAVEVELLGIEVGAVEEELAVGDEGLKVAIAAQERRTAGVGRCLEVYLVVVGGVVGAVAVVEDIDTGAILETEVAVPSHDGQRAEVPTLLDNLILCIFLCREAQCGGANQQTKKDTFHRDLV